MWVTIFLVPEWLNSLSLVMLCTDQAGGFPWPLANPLFKVQVAGEKVNKWCYCQKPLKFLSSLKCTDAQSNTKQYENYLLFFPPSFFFF